MNPRRDAEPARLVLLPGLDGTDHMYRTALLRAPASLRVTVQSYPSDAASGYDKLQDSLRPQLPDGEPFHLIGDSFAGPLALRLAASGLPGLRGVVLLASFVRPPGWWPVRILGRLLPWRWIFAVRAPAWALRATMVGWRCGDSAIGAARAAQRQAGPAAMARRLRAALTVDATDALRRCPVPILYLRAARDRVVGPRCLREILTIRPDVVHVRIESSHVLLSCAPEETWREIERFVDPASLPP